MTALAASSPAHGTVIHSSREYRRRGGNHSNTAENFFSIFKRGVIGTYHHMSEAHLRRYLCRVRSSLQHPRHDRW